MLLAQTTPDAATIFYISLLFIFMTAVITTVLTKWSRDKCLKLFHGYHVTIEALRGATDWGSLKVMSSGIELIYDHPYLDTRGRKKTSLLIYGAEIEQRVLTVFRYHDELSPEGQQLRLRQVRRTFNPGLFRRMARGFRNLLNTLRDAFNTAIGAAAGQFQRMNPGSAVLASQTGQVSQMGQTLLGKIAANAYEPLLEQYIGHPVILEVQDPLNPNNTTQQYGGFLADYTQQYVAVFSIDHTSAEQIELIMPESAEGEAMQPLPPLPPPPPIGGALPATPPPAKLQDDIAVWIDGKRIRISNRRADPLFVERIERQGFEPLRIGAVIPPNGFMSLPARDAAGAKLIMNVVRRVDVLAPRKFATVRHAGELVERPGLLEDLGLDQLPFVPALPGILKNKQPEDQQLPL